MELVDRLFCYVDFADNGCWLWTGCITTSGYGALNVNGKKVEVHKVSYELFKGPRIPGLDVMHSCDIKHCFNPKHLSQGTRKDNMWDAASKGMMSYRGTNKLTRELAELIRQRLANGERNKDLAEEYNVGTSLISDIKSGIKWKKLEKK